jgi:hypothetical protein
MLNRKSSDDRERRPRRRFQRIFDENAWGNTESVSGEGSNLAPP